MISLFGRREGAEGRLSAGGVALAYEVAGAGRPIVLVHGFASHRALNWKATNWFETLAEAGFQIAALDCRGHGASERPRRLGAYRLSAMAGDVAALIRHLRLERPDVMGYSMGARITLTLLLAEPDLVGRCVLGGVGRGLLEPGGAQAEAIATALEAPGAEGIADPIARRFRQFADRYKGDRAALAQCIREMWTPFAAADLAAIRTPVLIATGLKDDQIVDPESFARLIPGARHVGIPDRDHMTVIADRRFKAAILDFLAA